MTKDLRSPEIKCEDSMLSLLNEALKYSIDNTHFYKSHLQLTSINTIKEFEYIPFTTKNHVISSFPYNMLAKPISEVVAYYESSGTTSSSLEKSSKSPSFLTKFDLKRDIERRLLNCVEVSKDDVVLNGLPYAYTSCGLAFHLAYQEKGAMVIACNNLSSLDQTRKQNDISSILDPTILLSPYPLLYKSVENKESKSFKKIKSVILCGIVTSEKAKNKISKFFNNSKVFDVYGLSEFGAITSMCSFGKKHIIDKDFYVEIVDRQENIKNESFGEIVITTLNREGSPKIRYRTGDYGSKIVEHNCQCHNKSPILNVYGRILDQVMLENNKILLPIDIEDIICSFEETNGIYKIKLEESNNKIEKIVIDCEILDKYKTLETSKLIENKITDDLSIKSEVRCYHDKITRCSTFFSCDT